MGTFSIKGGVKLKGEVIPQGAKNEALQVICACLLTDKKVIIDNIPEIIDVLELKLNTTVREPSKTTSKDVENSQKIQNQSISKCQAVMKQHGM